MCNKKSFYIKTRTFDILTKIKKKLLKSHFEKGNIPACLSGLSSITITCTAFAENHFIRKHEFKDISQQTITTENKLVVFVFQNRCLEIKYIAP